MVWVMKLITGGSTVPKAGVWGGRWVDRRGKREERKIKKAKEMREKGKQRK